MPIEITRDGESGMEITGEGGMLLGILGAAPGGGTVELLAGPPPAKPEMEMEMEAGG